MGLTKMMMLEKYRDMACHNLLCYSKNYIMDEPKIGYEKEWTEAKTECDLLEEMIKTDLDEFKKKEAADERQPGVDLGRMVKAATDKEIAAVGQPEEIKSLGDYTRDPYLPWDKKLERELISQNGNKRRSKFGPS